MTAEMVRIREAFPIDTEAIVEETASGWRAVRPIDSELARLASVMATPNGCRSAW